MPDGRRVIIPYWRWPTLRVPWRRVKVGDVILFVLAAVIVYIIGRMESVR